MIVIASLATIVTTTTPASADPGNAADPTWETAGGVYGIARTPDRTFLGGAFTQVKPPSGTGALARVRLAALDPSGAPVPTWTPSANDIVWGLGISPDGTRVYAGGDFSAVSGKSRGHMAAIDALTGDVVDSWKPTTNGRVYAIATVGSRVYIAGSFSSVSGQTRQHVAAIDASTGQVVNGWNPGTDGTVRSIYPSPDGARLYLGGKFSSVDGASHPSLAAVDAATGTVLSWKPSVPAEVMSVAATQTRVVAGTAGQGGNCVGYDATSAAQKWLVHTDGNVQAVGIAGHLAYCGGHGALAGGLTRKKIFAADIDSGAVAAWNPGMNSTVGVRVIVGYGQQIAVGGDFTQVFTESREGFAQFTDTGVVPPGVTLPFSDDFAGGLSPWSGVTNATVDDLGFDQAKPGARFEVSGGKAFAYRPLSSPANTVCLRSSVSIISRDGSLVLLQLLAANGTPIAHAFVTPTGELQARSDVSGATLPSGAQLPFGWSTVELCATTGGGGSISLYLDGTPLGTWSANTGSSKVGRLQIGDATGGKAFILYADDVAADTSPLA
jgi:predicted small secreted protein